MTGHFAGAKPMAPSSSIEKMDEVDRQRGTDAVPTCLECQVVS
jgi:hypothetical protein